MSGKSEDIILQLNHIKYKKNNGQLYLSNKRIGWMMDEQQTFAVNVQYTDIKTTKISPEGKPRVQLQLVLNDTTHYTFQFTNPENREKQVAERDQVKDRLTQLLIQNRRQPPDELMEKKRVLEETPHLKELYLALVSTKILSADEFWKDIAGQYKQSLVPKMDVGVSAAFLADIKPQTDGNNGRVQYNLNPEIMCAIFKTYPSVKKKHDEYVPHRLSESEFWTRFFQSHYYSVHTTSRSENVFSECAKHDDKEWVRDVNSIRTDPFYDLTDIYEEKSCSVESDLKVTGTKAGSNHIHATMIKRFNQHSLNILKAQTVTEKDKIYDDFIAQNPNAGERGEIPEPDLKLHKSKKARLEEKLQYEDLEQNNKKETSTLVIHQKDRYLAGPSSYSTSDVIRKEQLPMLQNKLTSVIQRWQPSLHEGQESDSAYSTLEKFSESCRRGRTNNNNRTGDDLPRDLHKELMQVYRNAGELLRHFWSCFPARTTALQEKLHNMHNTLCSYYDTTVHPFKEMALRDYNCSSGILDHLLSMFHIANTKYENWKARNNH